MLNFFRSGHFSFTCYYIANHSNFNLILFLPLHIKMIEFIIGGVVVLIILIIIIAAALGAFSAPSAGAPAGYSPPSSTGGGSGLTIPPPPSPPSGSSGSGSGSTSGTTASVPPATTPAAPPPKPTCTGMSTFYEDKNYGGKSISLGKGYHDVTEIKSRLHFNDKISSWKLAPNCAAKMYKDDHRGGTVWQVPPLPAENPWVGDQINNKITEIEISDAM
jgi:hypothetical protein